MKYFSYKTEKNKFFEKVTNLSYKKSEQKLWTFELSFSSQLLETLGSFYQFSFEFVPGFPFSWKIETIVAIVILKKNQNTLL